MPRGGGRGLSETAKSQTYFCADLNASASAPYPVSWSYSWGLAPAAPCSLLTAGGIEFVPMIWGKESVNATLPFLSGVTHLLGFNEPNGAHQSNLSPAEAAALWPSVEATARAAGLSLVSPAPAGNGVAWLDAFFAACNGCLENIVAIAQHTYACSADALKSDLALYVKYAKPIWVTEFNCGNGSRNASDAEHLAYMEVALPILQADTNIER
jgi:hypothetical protein